MYDFGEKFNKTHKVCTSFDDVVQILKELEKEPFVAVDTETSGLDPYTRDICGYAFGTPNVGYYVPVRHMRNPIAGFELERVRSVLKMFLEKSGQPKVFFNAKFDIKMLQRDGIIVGPPVEDTSLLFPLLTIPIANFSLKLKDICREVLGFKTSGQETLKKEIHGKADMVKKYGYAFVPFHILGPYACEDGMMTAQLWRWMMAKMKE